MTESELAKALLELDTAEFENVTTTAELTRRVLQKDKRRVRVTAPTVLWQAAISSVLSAMALSNRQEPGLPSIARSPATATDS